jgi:hypothetical protein
VTSPSIPVDKAEDRVHFWDVVKRRFSTMTMRVGVIARASGSWARQHTNWFWLALAALLGLIYLYLLFSEQSPRWH